MNSEIVYDKFKEDDIVTFKNKKDYYLNINSIVLKNEYHNKDSIEKISAAIDKFIRLKQNRGYRIKAISSIAVNEFEIKVLEKLDFIKVKNITNEIYLYEKVY